MFDSLCSSRAEIEGHKEAFLNLQQYAAALLEGGEEQDTIRAAMEDLQAAQSVP